MTKHKLDPSVRKKGTDPNARRKLLPLKVYCTKEERAVIEEQAKTAGMSVSEYLRNVGKGIHAPDPLCARMKGGITQHPEQKRTQEQSQDEGYGR